ncbi:MAG TPA: ABC transporter substrate-binding protein [Phototrophicaceae bacterium]|jgi:ABC-type branched-subunit amino acid transport system substrate-binding protein|nr:ABC transporter substrate-binding protein [Phototrophicaceae bacterium]
MTRFFYFFLTIMLSLSLFVSSSQSIEATDETEVVDCVPATGTPIKIGAVFPTGDLFSTTAAAPYQGVQAITEAINACGGVNGQPIELIYTPANNRDQAQEALEQLHGQVSLIVGSGSPAVSEVLVNASESGDFAYWEVTEPLNQRTEWAFSPRPTGAQQGEQAAAFLLDDVTTLLNGDDLRLAIIHEDRPRALAVMDGINANPDLKPLIVQHYTNNIPNSYRLAVKLREQDINAVLVIAFESDASSFWSDLRQADANIQAWLQIGDETPRYDNCRHFGVTALGAAGAVNEDYRKAVMGDLYTQYRQTYLQQFNTAPTETADLAASGFYLLLKQVLPSIVSKGQPLTPSAIQTALLSQDTALITGMMSESLVIDSATGLNLEASTQSLIQQRQEDGFCTLAPVDAATCTNPLQSLPTWRERAIADAAGRCGR